MLETNIPILVGVGQVTDHPNDNLGLTPIELMVVAAQKALEDTQSKRLVKAITDVSATGLTVDAKQVKTPFRNAYDNIPRLVAEQLGMQDRRYFYAATGGNTPQYLVNHHARRIIEGHDETTLIVGGEALHNMFERFTPWYKLFTPWKGWRGKTGSNPSPLGNDAPGNTDNEGRYGLNLPAQVYPLFENALQSHYGRTRDEHHQQIGSMFSRFSHVASENPYAWFNTPRGASELITVSPSNRMIAYPYTKYLNSIIKVNQAASMVLTSVARARELGISQDKWVYLTGFANQNDHWFVSDRENFHSSPAIRSAGSRAMKMAGTDVDELEFLDIYSCFPSAVQIACDELGIDHNDTRGLTLTGGLPYFGGPGNNYSMHAIVEVVNRLRGTSNSTGFVNANGWYLTKHSVGVYSNIPPKSFDLALADPQTLSKDRVPQFNEKPDGKATVETFTAVYDKDGKPKSSIIVGRDSNNARFLANGPTDQSSIALMQGEESVVGQSGNVHTIKHKARFEFDT